VAGGIDYIDEGVFVFDCGIFGKDGDAPFSFEVVRVHDAIWYLFPLAEDAGLFEEGIH
jgi:hypothetical protein